MAGRACRPGRGCGPQPGSGPSSFDPSALLNLLPSPGQGNGNSGANQSFTASTRVLLPDGKTVPISRLKPGDKVLASDTRTGKNQAEAVTAVLVRRDTDLYDLIVKTKAGTQVIRTTSNHLFWVPGQRQWVTAGKLKKGEHLQTPDGTPAVADGGITPKNHDGWMWDLTVPGNNDHDFYVLPAQAGSSHHTYHVVAGDTPVLVHNAPVPPPAWLTPGNGVIYLRTDLNTGQEYIGQANSWNRYLARQSEHANLNPSANYSFEVVDQAPPGVQLDLLEESWIRAGGGKASMPGSVLSNKRMQMSNKRYTANGGGVSCP